VKKRRRFLGLEGVSWPASEGDEACDRITSADGDTGVAAAEGGVKSSVKADVDICGVLIDVVADVDGRGCGD
jgi:hypothetical protein